MAVEFSDALDESDKFRGHLRARKPAAADNNAHAFALTLASKRFIHGVTQIQRILGGFKLNSAAREARDAVEIGGRAHGQNQPIVFYARTRRKNKLIFDRIHARGLAENYFNIFFAFKNFGKRNGYAREHQTELGRPKVFFSVVRRRKQFVIIGRIRMIPILVHKDYFQVVFVAGQIKGGPYAAKSSEI